MNSPFLISDERLRALTATRQGRVSIAGYNYQAAYAVARLASMSLRQPVLDLDDWPLKLRYDWGEDLDEACNDGSIRFTQCKRVQTIGQPASLAEVLIGFAPKWLWVNESQRDKLGFRLVCSDSRFAETSTPPNEVKAEVLETFTKRLDEPAGQRSDRFQWADDASKVGHDVLFEELWTRLECIYLPADVIESGPAGRRLEAEKEALRMLLEWGHIDASRQPDVLAKLRRLVHDNLISFDPTNDVVTLSIPLVPRCVSRADVEAAINPYRPAPQRQPPFRLVDRTFLSEQRELERKQFVARQPEWSDLVHGPDNTIKFIERDQTEALEREVMQKVVSRVGATKLPTLFVIGAPGDGKTTITRRVAARLVEAGIVLIADTGVGLQEPPGDPDEYVLAIEKIQEFGRPVILLLDDPVYADSPWLEVVKKLNRPGSRVGVLAASPQFLLDEHQSEWEWPCRIEPFPMARISDVEREALAAVHGRSVTYRSADDFLVVAMEAAAGVSFSEIIDRLWLTLGDGRVPSFARTLSDLPWEMRAYLFVCFFSRVYEACPEPLLEKLLEITGGVSSTAPVAIELERMKQFTGWRIFRIGKATRADRNGQRVWATRKAGWTWGSMDYEGSPIAAAHAVIARQAWEQRPLGWCDVGEQIIEASLAVPTVIRDVVSTAVRLTSPTVVAAKWREDGAAFAKRLIERWFREPGLETQYLARLVLACSTLHRNVWVRPYRQTLCDRAIPDSQGWLAAQRLYYIPAKPGDDAALPVELDLAAIIRAADFSLWTPAAASFGQLLEPYPELRQEFVTRLFDAFDGKLEWKLDSILLNCLLTVAPIDEMVSRTSQLTDWLADNPDDNVVRNQYLSFLLKLPQDYFPLREAAARRTAKWLDDHPDNTNVRSKYLWFLLKLPPEFSHLREEAARQTADWLVEHPADSFVRTQFLSFLLQLPEAFSGLRHEAAERTAAWLDDHPKDGFVRMKYLSFLLELPPEFAARREAAAQQTTQWLNDNPKNVGVRTQFLRFLCGIESVGYWQRIARLALRDTMKLIKRNRYTPQNETMMVAARKLHDKLLKSLTVEDSEATREVLKRSHEIAHEWLRRNRPDVKQQFPLP